MKNIKDRQLQDAAKDLVYKQRKKKEPNVAETGCCGHGTKPDDEPIVKRKGNLNDSLMEQEEAEFHRNVQMLQDQMVQYLRSMVKLGNIKNHELKFLQQGVVFEWIKTRYFGIDPQALAKKKDDQIKGKT